MKYEEVKKSVFASAVQPDGYNGNTVRVGFALVEGRIMSITESGFFRSGMYAGSVEEAVKLISSKPMFSDLKIEPQSELVALSLAAEIGEMTRCESSVQGAIASVAFPEELKAEVAELARCAASLTAGAKLNTLIGYLKEIGRQAEVK